MENIKEERAARVRLDVFNPLTGDTAEKGDFLILAITAGTGNGWYFPPDVLRASLLLWDGVECFVDHSSQDGRTTVGRSISDLGGVCSKPVWDENRQGISLKLTPIGPAADLIRSVGLEMLGMRIAAPRVGFSADLLLRAERNFQDKDMKEVLEIIKILSLDLVYNPARGGAFLQALADGELPRSPLEKGNFRMNDAVVETPVPPDTPVNAHAMDLYGSLLDARLAASSLPSIACDQIRLQFSGRIFEPAELDSAVESARRLVAGLTGGSVVQGPGRITAVFDSRDQLQAAADDLLGAERDPNLAGVRPARLSGIRELYLALTGDVDMHGGYYPERARLATTADFSGLVKNSLNKVIANRWKELGEAGYN